MTAISQVVQDAHDRAFSVATSLPAERLQAMGRLVHSLAVTAVPWPIAETTLLQWCDAQVPSLPEAAPAHDDRANRPS